MKERKIYLIRHCQTELDIKKRLIGQCDVKLSSEGIELAHRLGQFLRGYLFDNIFCSSLTRTKETANIIASYLSMQPKSYQKLDEISLGDWDGCYIDDIKEKYPDEYMDRGNDFINYRIRGGENYFDLDQRVSSAFEKILGYEGNLLIVGHVGVNRVILANLLKAPLEDLLQTHQDYGCINIITQKQDHFEVEQINRILTREVI